MCEECHRYTCHPRCPNFMGNTVGSRGIRGSCSLCGEILYYSDKIFRKGEMTLCADCAEDTVFFSYKMSFDLYEAIKREEE